jgi:[ribosomal protein S5]-alanine N-acetyltransferase
MCLALVLPLASCLIHGVTRLATDARLAGRAARVESAPLPQRIGYPRPARKSPHMRRAEVWNVPGQEDDGHGSVLRRPIMLNGEHVVLRPVRERDLAAFINAHTEIANRGEFFPLGIQSESVLRRNYAETGFWERDEGTLLIWNRDDVMVGHIEFFRPVNYWDAYELSYQLYGTEHASQGYTTEAVRLLIDYLFGAKKVNRISLVIVPENAPSRRIAEKCGFQHEGTARGALFKGGHNVDVLIYSLLRDDPRPWHT